MRPITFFRLLPFYLDSFDSRYLLFAESLLFCYFFPPRSVENERRTRVTNFLCSLTSVSLSLRCSLPNPLCLSLYFFFIFLSPSLSCYSRGCCRGACFASDYYLPRSESTAGLWYTGSMVSRYTPATATPVLRPLGEPMHSPASSRRAPTASPVLQSPAVAVATALSSHHSPIRRTMLCRPSRAASTFYSRGSRDVSTVNLSECYFFIGLLGKPRCLVTTIRLHLEQMGRPTFN